MFTEQCQLYSVSGSNTTRMIKNKIFKQRIGIAKKAKKQEGIAGVVMLSTNPYFD